MPNDENNIMFEEEHKKPSKAFLIGLPCPVCKKVGFTDKVALTNMLMIYPNMTWVCSTECAEKIQKEKFPFLDLAKDLLPNSFNIDVESEGTEQK